jgi:hypothetical protein
MLTRPPVSLYKVKMRQQVFEVKCDRCNRVEYRDAADMGSKGVSLKLELTTKLGELPNMGDTEHNVLIDFTDLCGPCSKRVVACVQDITKRLKGKSPDRKLVAKEESVKPSPGKKPKPVDLPKQI